MKLYQDIEEMINDEIQNFDDITEAPYVALRGLVMFPGVMSHVDIGRPASIRALNEAADKDRLLFVSLQRDAEEEKPKPENLYSVGTLVRIKHILHAPGISRVICMGLRRARLDSLEERDGVQYARFTYMPEPLPEKVDQKAMRLVRKIFLQYINLSGETPDELIETLNKVDQPTQYAYMVANQIECDPDKLQLILETDDATERLFIIAQLLAEENELQEVENRIRAKVHETIEKQQKQYFLREEIQEIKRELGEDDESVADKLRKRIEASAMSDEARQAAQKELRRMENMAPGMPEISITRSYIEFLLDLPWETPKTKPMKIDRARRILDADHYGLEKVKQRVLEYLAVRELNTDGKAPILCLVGAPGVGKTSIARSVAKALGRKYVRMSLGGVNDEAEIRGHRRTYVGAMPGRILALMRKAGAKDPVFLLDEIDKLTSSMHGDPASALLEALDPEQNSNFSDHYAEVPYDLSKVLFITTANVTDTIPGPLQDRMEIIEVPSYTLEEKVQIAKKHLWPKQLKEVNILKALVKIPDATLRALIEGYTAEAGVRSLERELQSVLRKAAVQLLEVPEEERKPITVHPGLLEEWLGPARYFNNEAEKKPEVGIVNGLAWTSIGGKTLTVEATVMPGSGALELTGQLGDVMKESARTAYSYIRSRGEQYHIDADFHKKNDLHVHFPEGAVPKDGPSAGVAMTCAMLSAITGKPARQDIAMTGEVTLRGKVLPIGGVKEKLLAAYRMGMSTVLLPEQNKADLRELPEEVRKKLQVQTITGVDQAIHIVLGSEQ